MVLFLVLITVVGQWLWPDEWLPLGVKIDGLDVGGWQKSDAILALNEQAESERMEIFVQDEPEAIDEVTVDELGVEADNRERVEQINCPWYLRLVPTSALWYGLTIEVGTADYRYDEGRMAEYVAGLAEKVDTAAGVTKVKVENFVEVECEEGAVGRKLDQEATSATIKAYFEGKADRIWATATAVEATEVERIQSYAANNDEELLGVVKKYISGQSGTFGVQLFELTGEGRAVGVNQEMQFTTASTYKLFVAYSTLLAVESGKWQWSNAIYNGWNLATCFDKMIVLSDNGCAETLFRKYGTANINRDIWAVGLSRQSGWINGSPKTTALDLAKFLGLLETKQLPISEEGRARLLDAMKRNVYRQGVPSGAGGAAVADKVGFLYALLHDAAIVYSEKGTYVLVILTNRSSWSAIAGLTQVIEDNR